MPWDVVRRDGSYIVVDKSGRVYGKHKTKREARQQQKALYASEGRKHGK